MKNVWVVEVCKQNETFIKGFTSRKKAKIYRDRMYMMNDVYSCKYGKLKVS